MTAPAQKRRPLFDIVSDLLAQLEAAGGEVTDALDQLDVELQSKCEAYAAVIRQLEAESGAFNELVNEYTARAAQRHRTAQALRQRLAQGLAAARIERVITPTARLHLSATTKLELDDHDAFIVQCDPRFLRTETMISRAEIKRALEAGETIPGARLLVQRHLRIT